MVSPLVTDLPEERSDLVRQMFDRISRRYDLNNALLSFGLDRYWLWRVRRVLNLPADGQLIDLCCGTGASTRAMAQAVPRGRVVGVDFSDGMLSVAAKAVAKPGAGEIVYVRSDVLKVPEPSHAFDAAMIAHGPRNIVDLSGLWKEMARLVKPGGQVLSLELTRPPGLMGTFHALYLRYVVQFVGGLVSGDREAYSYLRETIAAFLDPRALAQSMRESGLQDVRIIPLSGGIVTVHHARTPAIFEPA
jgi:demethylmenaquinone methyltransferase/2-methoxy-6-polyprenyl-1,4-benzoquinol methylase